VAWGAYHGLLLAVYRRFGSWWDALPDLIRQAAMFLAAVVGWVLFRATSFTMASRVLGRMFWPTAGTHLDRVVPILLGLSVAAWWSMRGPNAHDLHTNFTFTPKRALVLAAALGCGVALMAVGGSSPFLYFQF
jgi:hypothetical protein